MPGYGEADLIQELEAKIATLTSEIERERDTHKRMELWTLQSTEEIWKSNDALTAERDALQAATRKVVEAAQLKRNSRWDSSKEFVGEWYVIPMDDLVVLRDALSDPTIVALGRTP